MLARHGERFGVVAVQDQFREGARAGDVGAFANIDEQRIVADVDRLQTGQAQTFFDLWCQARRALRDDIRNCFDVLWRGATTTAGDIEPTRRCPLLMNAANSAGNSSYSAIALGRPAFGCADTRHRRCAHFLDVRSQFARQVRSSKTDGDQIRVAHRVVERFDDLAGERATGGVSDGAGDHHGRPVIAIQPARFVFFDGENRGFGVERIENGFDQDDIGSAVKQSAQGIAIGILTSSNVTAR